MPLLEPEYARQHIDVRGFLDPQLRVEGVRLQIQQVLITLVENAIDAMPGVSLRLHELKIRSASCTLLGAVDALVTVQDSGRGLAAEAAEHLFDGLFTTGNRGLGLGLATSRTIVAAPGGKLWAHSTPDHGARFQFFIPLHV